MSLFGTINTATTGLQASQLGLQVVGNNVANSSTPGYIRQRLELETNPATRLGGLLVGNGVRPTGISQVVDKALMHRMFAAGSDKAAGETLNRAFEDLENLVGNLSGGLRQSMFSFNNALHDLSATPNDRSLRDFVILQGESLARDLRSIYQSIADLQGNINTQLDDLAKTINEKLAGIAKLNIAISGAEGGGAIRSDASGLREQRNALVESLSTLVNVNVHEQSTGSLSVFIGGDFVVSEGTHRDVEKFYNESVNGFELRIRQSQATLQANSGRYGALIRSRTEVFGTFVNDLDSLAASLAKTVNDIHTQGQGRVGFESLVSAQAGQAGVPLRNAQLPTKTVNGAFDIQLVDASGNPVSFHRIHVRATNQVTDSTLNSIAADISTIDGLTANIRPDGRLEIESTSPHTRFTFANDTSGFLSAIGINTFFVGNSAKDIDINPVLKRNSDHLAISRSGISRDTEVLTELVDLVERPMDSLGGRSVLGIFNENVASLGQRISLQRSITQGASDLQSLLSGQHLGMTGVNIDEESIKMLAYNRAFQANARVITTANEMLEILMQI